MKGEVIAERGIVMKRVALVVIPLLVCGIYWGVSMVEFVPIVFDNRDGLVVSKEPAEQGFTRNLKHVLSYYGEDFAVDERGAVLVSRFKWNDRDLMWNYTAKARDAEWLQSHALESDSQ